MFFIKLSISGKNGVMVVKIELHFVAKNAARKAHISIEHDLDGWTV